MIKAAGLSVREAIREKALPIWSGVWIIRRLATMRFLRHDRGSHSDQSPLRYYAAWYTPVPAIRTGFWMFCRPRRSANFARKMANWCWMRKETGLPEARLPIAAIILLGITQIIGYGTLYYSFSILAPGMARNFGYSTEWVFGLLSGALLLGGFVAP